MTLVTGDVVRLTCMPDSGIPIKVTWLKDGNKLTPQANDSLLLHIRSRKESGRYECIATSKRGEEVLAIDVIVYGELITENGELLGSSLECLLLRWLCCMEVSTFDRCPI